MWGLSIIIIALTCLPFEGRTETTSLDGTWVHFGSSCKSGAKLGRETRFKDAVANFSGDTASYTLTTGICDYNFGNHKFELNEGQIIALEKPVLSVVCGKRAMPKTNVPWNPIKYYLEGEVLVLADTVRFSHEECPVGDETWNLFARKK